MFLPSLSYTVHGPPTTSVTGLGGEKNREGGALLSERRIRNWRDNAESKILSKLKNQASGLRSQAKIHSVLMVEF